MYIYKNAPEEISGQYTEQNNIGNGIGIGEETDTIEEAIEREGWELVDSYVDSLALAKDGDTYYAVGGDGMRRMAWAVEVEVSVSE